jgi:hypothetical protein
LLRKLNDVGLNKGAAQRRLLSRQQKKFFGLIFLLLFPMLPPAAPKTNLETEFEG